MLGQTHSYPIISDARSGPRFGPPCHGDSRFFAVSMPKGVSRNSVNYGVSGLRTPGSSQRAMRIGVFLAECAAKAPMVYVKKTSQNTAFGGRWAE